MNDALVNALEPLHADAFGWALHCCGGTHAEAADVLQNAYLKVLKGKAAWHGRSPLKTWWFGVIRLSAKEEQRRRRFRESLPGKILRFVAPSGEEYVASNPSLELDESAQELRRCLSLLPSRQAKVLHLIFYQDLTLAGAAGIMGISVGSARTHYERGKARLRELLPGSPFKTP